MRSTISRSSRSGAGSCSVRLGTTHGAAPAGPCAAMAARQVAEVLHQAAAVLGADGLGVELDAPQRSLAVSDTHQHAVVGPRDRRKPLGQRPGHAQRVVADRLEALRDPGEQRAAVVVHGAEPAVHHLRRVDHRAAGEAREALVPEADTQDWDPGLHDRLAADPEVARVLGTPRAGRDDDVVEPRARQLGPRRTVVAHDDRILAVRLGEKLEQVERERVVVVQQQGPHVSEPRTPPLAAGCSARWPAV